MSSTEKSLASSLLDLDATRRLSATPTARHFRGDAGSPGTCDRGQGGGGQGKMHILSLATLQPSVPHTERQEHTWPPRAVL